MKTIPFQCQEESEGEDYEGAGDDSDEDLDEEEDDGEEVEEEGIIVKYKFCDHKK